MIYTTKDTNTPKCYNTTMNVTYGSFIKDPDKVRFVGEDAGEKVMWVFRRHPITNLGWVLITVVLFLVPHFVSAYTAFTGISFFETLPWRYNFIFYTFWYLFVFGYAFENFISWFFNVYIVSNKRVVDVDFFGLIHRRISEAELQDIEDITHQINGAAQIIFNYGSVFIQTAGEQREFEFELVPNPARVQDIISDLSSAVRSKQHGYNK